MTIYRQMMKWTKCAIRFLRISRPGVRVPSIAPRKPEHIRVLVFLLVCIVEGTRTGRRRIAPQAISPVQQRRPQPAAETGRSCWDRVLIFQSHAKGAAEKSANATRCCCLARGSQRVGMSTVEAVNRKISWLFCFVSHGCTVFARSVFSMSDDVGRCIALQSVPFFASGEQG